MDIKELVNGLKEKGLTDEQIAQELLKMKQEIDAILGANDEQEANDEHQDEEKMKEVFGI